MVKERGGSVWVSPCSFFSVSYQSWQFVYVVIESVYDFAKILIGKSMVRGHEENAHLVEQVHGEADNGEGDDIGGGGDDGGDDQNRHDGMTAILLHVFTMEDAQASEQPGEDGNLKDDAHRKGEENERVDVAFQADKVLHLRVHLITCQESEGDGEKDEVAEEQSQHEHHIGSNDERRGIAPLIFV